MKFIEQNAWQYLSVKLPAVGAFLLLVVIPLLQWLVDFQIIPEQYHATITGVIMVGLSWFGKKLYQPKLHSSALGFVAVTAGHSDSDPGAVRGSVKEAEFMTQFRNAVAFYLMQAGLTVKTDGVGSVNFPLAQAIAIGKGADIKVNFI